MLYITSIAALQMNLYKTSQFGNVYHIWEIVNFHWDE